MDQALPPGLAQRLEELASALEAERAKNETLKGKLVDLEARGRADPTLTVLTASKDLWRGVDENRPPRPDTVRSPAPVVEKLDAEGAQVTERLVPSERDAMEAAVARSVRQAHLATAG